MTLTAISQYAPGELCQDVGGETGISQESDDEAHHENMRKAGNGIVSRAIIGTRIQSGADPMQQGQMQKEDKKAKKEPQQARGTCLGGIPRRRVYKTGQGCAIVANAVRQTGTSPMSPQSTNNPKSPSRPAAKRPEAKSRRDLGSLHSRQILKGKVPIYNTSSAQKIV